MSRRLALWVLSIVLVGCAQEQEVTDPTSAAGPLARLVGKATSCPSGAIPGPGDVLAGGIEVDGECLLDHITVTGGIVVDPGADLEIEGSAISGGIKVAACAELDVDLADHTAPSGARSTIAGDVTVAASTDCPSGGFSDLDIWTAGINGKLVISGNYLGGPTICDNQISGDVVLDHVTSAHPFWLGDPEAPFGCPGNRIGGTLSVSNSLAVGDGRTLEVEANRVAGSVLLRASTLEFNANTIGGSLLCSNGTLIVTGEPDGDPAGNTVRGVNTCG